MSRFTFHFALVEIGTNFKTGLSVRPDFCRQRPLVGCTLNASRNRTSAATVKSASPQNPLAIPVNKSCTGVQGTSTSGSCGFPKHLNAYRALIVCVIHKSCTMCLKCAPSCRKWRLAPPLLKWLHSITTKNNFHKTFLVTFFNLKVELYFFTKKTLHIRIIIMKTKIITILIT